MIAFSGGMAHKQQVECFFACQSTMVTTKPLIEDAEYWDGRIVGQEGAGASARTLGKGIETSPTIGLLYLFLRPSKYLFSCLSISQTTFRF